MQRIVLRLALVAVTLAPSAAFAHPGHGDPAGFAHGFAHPTGGLDHVLAMVTVGLLAWQLGGRALWLVPATFVLVMGAGGLAGITALPLPLVEMGIALSVVVLGAIVALGVKAPAAAAMGIVALFAIFHGYAHGSEMPADGSGLAYAAGFMAATALLHIAGIAIGFGAGRLSESWGPLAWRLGGAAVSLAGVAILIRVM